MPDRHVPSCHGRYVCRPFLHGLLDLWRWHVRLKPMHSDVKHTMCGMSYWTVPTSRGIYWAIMSGLFIVSIGGKGFQSMRIDW